MKSTFAMIAILIVPALALMTGCSMKPIDYYRQGTAEMNKYDCASDSSFRTAAEMELEDEGNWYPIYMMSLGLSRTYCQNYTGSLKAFQTVDQFTVKKSEVGGLTKGVEFVKSRSRRMYELTDREETLLHFYLGVANYQLGNHNDALVELKKVDYIAEGTYSALPLASLMRGLIYAKLNQIDNAMVGFRKVIEVNPTCVPAYKLAIAYATSATDRDFFIRTLKDKCGVDYAPPAPGERPIVVFYEFKENYDPDYKLFAKYGSIGSNPTLLDAVDPNFDFGKFLGGVMKEVASAVARDMASRATCGLSGLFLGGGEGDAREWHTLPRFYFVDVVFVQDGVDGAILRELEEGKVRAERSFDLPPSHDVRNVRF